LQRINAMTTTLTPTKKLIDLRERIAIKNRRNFLKHNFEKQGFQFNQKEDENDKYYRHGE
jgi:hypothetical protein